MQDMMTESDAAKVDANAKAGAPDTSAGSKIDNPKINVKGGIEKPCAVVLELSQNVSSR